MFQKSEISFSVCILFINCNVFTTDYFVTAQEIVMTLECNKKESS
jgi:hypothetical protein